MFRSEKQALEHEKIAGGKVILLPNDQSIILKKSDEANTYCLLEAWKSVSTKAVQDAFRMIGIFPLHAKVFDNKFVDREDILKRATEFKIIIPAVTPALMHEPQNQGSGVFGANPEDEEEARANAAASAPSERTIHRGSRGVLSKKTLSEAKKRNHKGRPQALCADITMQLLDQLEEEKRQQEKAKSEKAAKKMKTCVAANVRTPIPGIQQTLSSSSVPPVFSINTNGGEGSSRGPPNICMVSSIQDDGTSARHYAKQ
eukprot:ANDGO_01854.mRNA.1 hypothetical protein